MRVLNVVCLAHNTLSAGPSRARQVRARDTVLHLEYEHSINSLVMSVTRSSTRKIRCGIGSDDGS